MATHASILAWKIPWTEEPGRAPVHGLAKSQTRLSEFSSLRYLNLQGGNFSSLRGTLCDRFFYCRSSLYSLCIEVSEFEQQDIRNTDCCCCLVAQSCPTLCALWSAAHQASLSFTIS